MKKFFKEALATHYGTTWLCVGCVFVIVCLTYKTNQIQSKKKLAESGTVWIDSKINPK